MRCLTSTDKRFRRWVVLKTYFAFTWAIGFATCSSQGPDAEVIRAAWELRRKNITTSQYYTKTSRRITKEGLSLFTNIPENLDQLTIDSRFTVAMSDLNHISFLQRGDRWNSAIRKLQSRSRAGKFDGDRLFEFYQEPNREFGVIRNGSRSLIYLDTLIPFLLWLFPETWLDEMQGYDLKTMSLESKRFPRTAGMIEILVQNRNSKDWIASLHLNSAKGFVVERLILEWKGMVMKDLEIGLTQTDTLVTISSWKNRSYTESGELNSVETAKVTKCSINKSILPTKFKMDFPNKVYVREHSKAGNRYFRSGGNGELLPVTDEQFINGIERPQK